MFFKHRSKLALRRKCKISARTRENKSGIQVIVKKVNLQNNKISAQKNANEVWNRLPGII